MLILGLPGSSSAISVDCADTLIMCEQIISVFEPVLKGC